jgi:hypothetical protein
MITATPWHHHRYSITAKALLYKTMNKVCESEYFVGGLELGNMVFMHFKVSVTVVLQ